MPSLPFKTKIIVVTLVLVALAVAVFVFTNYAGRLRLPVGNQPPAISLGERHGLILASDGSLWTWGSDFLGWPVLGLGNRMLKSTTLRRIGHQTNWVDISAGINHSVAIQSDGTIWTWGESVRSLHGGLKPISTPVHAAPGNDWKQAAAGGNHIVALKKEGTLWAWGNNWSGAVGIASTNGSAVPVQVGSSTNWTKVWAGILETVALQSDGSLWYWGENPDPAFAQKAGQIFTPMRISPDTNWVDVGFGVNTEFAIKSDGTLWVWGRHAEDYSGTTNLAQNAIPTRVGTNSDWRSLTSCTGWWCQGLIKKDGSLWFMDASDGDPNGPRGPYPKVLIRRAEFQGPYVAYAAGATHAAGPGIHGPIGVVLTPEGEVWTWGMVLGDPPADVSSGLQAAIARIANALHLKVSFEPPPLYRDKPWQLRNVESEP